MALLAVLTAVLLVTAGHAATITIVNLDGPSEGFNDPTPAAPIGGNSGTTVGQQRLIVFERAAQIWGARLVSTVPIRVAANFDPLSCTVNQAVLGSAGPVTVLRDFVGAPLPGVWYAVALANSIAGEDLDPDGDDIHATFNSDLGQADCLPTASWYYGLDGNNPANTIDLLDTILHEFVHGFGFVSTVNLSTGGRLNGFNDTFMYHLEDHTSGKTFPQMTDAERRSASTDTGNLHWVGTNVIVLSGILSAGRGPGGHVEMYAPDPVESGSSVSHFSDSLSPDELMEPFATPSSDSRLTVELLKDIGWRIASSGPFLVANSSALTEENCAPANLAIDPGEAVSVRFGLRNIGSSATSNLVATLLPTGGVSAPSPAQSYGVIAANGPEVARTFSFLANQPCGANLVATLHLQDGSNDLGAVTFTFKVGRSMAVTNGASINVPLSGTASPYPSSISISGQSQPVSSVSVTLFNLQHSNPDDLDVLLVGPGGQSVMLMSDAGGSADISGVSLTFSDSAAASLPDSTQIASGTYRPTNFGTDDALAAPAPAGPYGTALSIFDGTSANGVWSLYVYDDNHPRSGAIARGWSLSFNTCCAGNTNANIAPTITLSASTVTYIENSAPVLVDPTGTIADPDSPDLNGGRLTIEIATNASTADRLIIRNEGTGAGQIGVAGSVVRFGGSAIGTWSGGSTGMTPLTIDFNSPNATLSAVQAVLRNVAFQNVSDDPSPSPRTVRCTLIDGDGSTGLPASRTVTVSPVNDPPTLAALVDRAVPEGSAIVITNFASDPDTPASLLSFRIVEGPIGLEINTTNGLLTWTPAETQGPSATTVRIAVQDNGLLSATQTFSIAVLEVNEAPVLAPLVDRVIHQGMTLRFTNAATDVDIPANSLTFSLSNAPAGAIVDPTTGVFLWTPQPQQANTTNQISVIVTDDGTPARNDTKAVLVAVLPPPVIESIALAVDNVTLVWRSIPGATYRVEYNSAPDQNSWDELPGDVTATGATASKNDTIAAATQRFYRIRVLP